MSSSDEAAAGLACRGPEGPGTGSNKVGFLTTVLAAWTNFLDDLGVELVRFAVAAFFDLVCIALSSDVDRGFVMLTDLWKA